MKTLRSNASSDSQVYATEYFAMVKRVVESVRGEAGMRPDRTGKRQGVNVEGYKIFDEMYKALGINMNHTSQERMTKASGVCVSDVLLCERVAATVLKQVTTKTPRWADEFVSRVVSYAKWILKSTAEMEKKQQKAKAAAAALDKEKQEQAGGAAEENAEDAGASQENAEDAGAAAEDAEDAEAEEENAEDAGQEDKPDQVQEQHVPHQEQAAEAGEEDKTKAAGAAAKAAGAACRKRKVEKAKAAMAAKENAEDAGAAKENAEDAGAAEENAEDGGAAEKEVKEVTAVCMDGSVIIPSQYVDMARRGDSTIPSFEGSEKKIVLDGTIGPVFTKASVELAAASISSPCSPQHAAYKDLKLDVLLFVGAFRFAEFSLCDPAMHSIHHRLINGVSEVIKYFQDSKWEYNSDEHTHVVQWVKHALDVEGVSQDVIKPLVEFKNYLEQLEKNWRVLDAGAAEEIAEDAVEVVENAEDAGEAKKNAEDAGAAKKNAEDAGAAEEKAEDAGAAEEIAEYENPDFDGSTDCYVFNLRRDKEFGVLKERLLPVKDSAKWRPIDRSPRRHMNSSVFEGKTKHSKMNLTILRGLLRRQGLCGPDVNDKVLRHASLLRTGAGCVQQNWHEDLYMSVIIALEENTMLLVKVGGVAKKVRLKAGQGVVFGGGFTHAGAGYEKQNVRVHVFITPKVLQNDFALNETSQQVQWTPSEEQSKLTDVLEPDVFKNEGLLSSVAVLRRAQAALRKKIVDVLPSVMDKLLDMKILVKYANTSVDWTALLVLMLDNLELLVDDHSVLGNSVEKQESVFVEALQLSDVAFMRCRNGNGPRSLAEEVFTEYDPKGRGAPWTGAFKERFGLVDGSTQKYTRRVTFGEVVADLADEAGHGKGRRVELVGGKSSLGASKVLQGDSVWLPSVGQQDKREVLEGFVVTANFVHYLMRHKLESHLDDAKGIFGRRLMLNLHRTVIPEGSMETRPRDATEQSDVVLQSFEKQRCDCVGGVDRGDGVFALASVPACSETGLVANGSFNGGRDDHDPAYQLAISGHQLFQVASHVDEGREDVEGRVQVTRASEALGEGRGDAIVYMLSDSGKRFGNGAVYSPQATRRITYVEDPQNTELGFIGSDGLIVSICEAQGARVYVAEIKKDETERWSEPEPERGVEAGTGEEAPKAATAHQNSSRKRARARRKRLMRNGSKYKVHLELDGMGDIKTSYSTGPSGELTGGKNLLRLTWDMVAKEMEFVVSFDELCGCGIGRNIGSLVNDMGVELKRRRTTKKRKYKDGQHYKNKSDQASTYLASTYRWDVTFKTGPGHHNVALVPTAVQFVGAADQPFRVLTPQFSLFTSQAISVNEELSLNYGKALWDSFNDSRRDSVGKIYMAPARKKAKVVAAEKKEAKKKAKLEAKLEAKKVGTTDSQEDPTSQDLVFVAGQVAKASQTAV